ncbi:MAG: MFS transporter [Chloroflexi bacterium]|nr:MFS transporter [Chloroflexota bacterium]
MFNSIRNIKTFDSLKLRDYRLLWLSQITTSFGGWMDQIARTWLIYSLTNSPLHLGLVSAARGLPMLAFGIVAGVAADRFNRKIQLIVAQVVNAILNVVLATLVITGHIQIWHIYITAIFSGTVQAFQQPARQALINDIVGKKHLLNAIALLSMAFSVSRIVGPAIGGGLIAAFGVGISYYIQAALFALATVWTLQIKIPESPKNVEAKQSFLNSTKEGFSYVVHQRLILALMILGLAPILLGMPYLSLMPIFARDVLHGNASTQGLLLMASGIGAILGALIIASLNRQQGSGRLLIIGAVGYGLSLVLFSRSPILWMAMIFTFCAGFSLTGYTSQDQTIIQTLAPDEIRGRVLGIYFLNQGLMPLGSLLAGVLAEFLGGPLAITIMGSSCVLIVIGVVLFMPKFWKLNFITNKSGI